MTPLGTPSRLLLAHSIAFMGLCVVSIALAVALLMRHVDAIAIVLALEFGGIPLLCLYWQYLGTFRRDARSAIRAAGACFGLATLSCGWFALLMLGVVWTPSQAGQPWETIGLSLALGLYFVFVGRLNRAWYDELRVPRLLRFPPPEKTDAPPESPPVRGFRWTVRELLLLMTLVGIVLGLALSIQRLLDGLYGSVQATAAV